MEPDERVPRAGVHERTRGRGMVRAGGWPSGVATGIRRFHSCDPESFVGRGFRRSRVQFNLQTSDQQPRRSLRSTTRSALTVAVSVEGLN